MPYCDDDMIPISSLTHYAYCPRRCALTHTEQFWDENVLTEQGRILHERADSMLTESRKDIRIARTLRLMSKRLGLSGIADIVEFHKTEVGGVKLPNCSGQWIPYPVEYKRGAANDLRSYRIQLCAQTLCLEEMLQIAVPEGALYLGVHHQRVVVNFDLEIRAETENICFSVHQLLASGMTPLPQRNASCSSCSLWEYCVPGLSRTDASRWIDEQIQEAGL